MMSRCNICDGSCACHINPPCGFCEAHIHCEICGELTCEPAELENNSDGSKILICTECAEGGE